MRGFTNISHAMPICPCSKSFGKWIRLDWNPALSFFKGPLSCVGNFPVEYISVIFLKSLTEKCAPHSSLDFRLNYRMETDTFFPRFQLSGFVFHLPELNRFVEVISSEW